MYKLFIGGLTIETTEKDILNHFSKYGIVYDIIIIRNRSNNASKGYGFITCNDRFVYEKIMSKDHIINGRLIDCHISFKKCNEPDKFKENANKKIFVGGLSLDTSDEDLSTYFSRYGNVRQAYVIKDPISKRSKKFGFVIMKSQKDVETILSADYHVINNIYVSCKVFVRIDGAAAIDPYEPQDSDQHEKQQPVPHAQASKVQGKATGRAGIPGGREGEESRPYGRCRAQSTDKEVSITLRKDTSSSGTSGGGTPTTTNTNTKSTTTSNNDAGSSSVTNNQQLQQGDDEAYAGEVRDTLGAIGEKVKKRKKQNMIYKMVILREDDLDDDRSMWTVWKKSYISKSSASSKDDASSAPTLLPSSSSTTLS